MIGWKKFTITTSLVFGLLYILLLPPGQAPDEPHHFFRSLHLGDGHLFAQKTEDKRMGGIILSGYPTYINFFQFLRYQPDAKISYAQHKKSFQISRGSPIFFDFPNVGYYAPIAYLPQAMMCFFTSQFQIKPAISFYLSRLIGLGTWLFILILMFRFIRVNRMLLSIAALTPSLLIIQSGITADLFTNALGFLWIAYYLGIWEGKIQKINSISIIVGLAVVLIIVWTKPVYWPLTWLVFCVPTSHFRKSWLRWLLVILPLIIILPWYQFLSDFFIPFDNYHPSYRDGVQLNPGVNPLAQLSFIFENPVFYIHVLFSSWADSFLATWAHWIGKFGWEANYLPWPFILIYSLLLMYGGNHAQLLPEIRNRILMVILLICIVVSILVSTVIYLQWSPLHSSSILALNGRYLFFLLPLFPILFSGLNKFKIKPIYIQGTIISCHMVMVFAIYLRYYHI